MIRIRSAGALLAAGMMLVATTVQAQKDTTVRIDEHWRAYLGCWTSAASNITGPMVCVVPTSSPQTVEFVTVVGDSIVSTVPLSASGARIELTRDGCTGWESARWSIDERRLYTHAEFTCAGGVTQRANGMLAMRYTDAFSRIDGLRTRGAVRTRVVNFQLTMDSTLYPAAIAARIPSASSMPAFGARMEAAAEVSTADIVDASKELDSPIIEAWIADRGQRFSAGANELRAMKSAGVPEGVIDMVVAVSNPRYFTLAQNGAPMARPIDPFQRRNGNAASLTRAEMERLRMERQLGGYGTAYGNLFDWNDLYFPWSGYGAYGRYGNPLYGNPLYGGYSQYWGPFGPIYGSGGGWVTGGSPIVIIPTTPSQSEPPGRVINGSGYSQGGSSSGRGAEPRSPSVGTWDSGSASSGSSGGSTSGSASSGSSGGSTSGGAAPAPTPSSAGGGEQRTAKPRP